MRAVVRRFIRDEQGLELVEYAVMLALIIALVIGVIVILAQAVSNRFGEAASVVSASYS